MICRFHFSAPKRSAAKPLDPQPTVPRSETLVSVLGLLVGRQVALFLGGGQQVAGKLVSVQPLYVVGAQGAARLVDIERVLSVAY